MAQTAVQSRPLTGGKRQVIYFAFGLPAADLFNITDFLFLISHFVSVVGDSHLGRGKAFIPDIRASTVDHLRLAVRGNIDCSYTDIRQCFTYREEHCFFFFRKTFF